MRQRNFIKQGQSKRRFILLIVILLFLILFLRGTLLAQFSAPKVERLQERLDSIVLSAANIGVSISVKAVHADYYKTLFEYQPEIKLIPASITKLITCACAYSKLGQSYNFETIIYTDDNNLGDGVINGNLYLKGYGDPDLSSADISALSEQVAKINIKQITGNIVADESFFDNDYHTLSGYYSGDTGPSNWPYVNALAFNKNEGLTKPDLSAADLLAAYLKSDSIEIDGVTIAGNTPKGAKEITRFSRPIYYVLSNMSKESDNHSAITVFKLLGAKLKSNPGTLKSGQEVIESFLTEIGVNRYSYEILEGSGLSRFNQVTADVYVKLLKYMYDDRFLFDYFLNSLSVAGKDGTLKKRMNGTQAEGNVYAKTGTLNGVSSLSGYVIDKDNEIIIFFITMNGFGNRTNFMRSVQDDFCITLAEFSRN